MNKNSNLQKDNCCVTFFKILFATTDVFDDAHNTFLRDEQDDPRDKETQMDELNRGCTSFNWSDDEINSEQEKYSKKKRPSSREKYNAPPVKKAESKIIAKEV